jgi:hypothetical protein
MWRSRRKLVLLRVDPAALGGLLDAAFVANQGATREVSDEGRR